MSTAFADHQHPKMQEKLVYKALGIQGRVLKVYFHKNRAPDAKSADNKHVETTRKEKSENLRHHTRQVLGLGNVLFIRHSPADNS